jgi:hypothetical protein
MAVDVEDGRSAGLDDQLIRAKRIIAQQFLDVGRYDRIDRNDLVEAVRASGVLRQVVEEAIRDLSAEGKLRTYRDVEDDFGYYFMHADGYDDFWMNADDLLVQTASLRDVLISAPAANTAAADRDAIAPAADGGDAIAQVGDDVEHSPDPSAEEQANAHAVDFRSVQWNSRKYTFTPTQAAVVKILWQHYDSGTPEVGGDTLLAEADSDATQLRQVFRKSEAWGEMIVQGSRKGIFRLADSTAGRS